MGVDGVPRHVKDVHLSPELYSSGNESSSEESAWLIKVEPTPPESVENSYPDESPAHASLPSSFHVTSCWVGGGMICERLTNA